MTVEHHDVTISGERKWDESADRTRYRRIEPDQVNAKFEERLLRLTLPKSAGARPRRIAIS